MSSRSKKPAVYGPLSGVRGWRCYALEHAFTDLLRETGEPVTVQEIEARALRDYDYGEAVGNHMRWLMKRRLAVHPDRHTWTLP